MGSSTPAPVTWPRRSRCCRPRCATVRGWCSRPTASRRRWPPPIGIRAQLLESSRLVAERLGRADWALVFQSRSGRPTDPWLEPDVCAYLRAERARGLEAAVLCPIGFVCDHIEVLYDLDFEAAAVCREIGLADGESTGRQRRSGVRGHDGRRGSGDLDSLQRRTSAADRRRLDAAARDQESEAADLARRPVGRVQKDPATFRDAAAARTLLRPRAGRPFLQPVEYTPGHQQRHCGDGRCHANRRPPRAAQHGGDPVPERVVVHQVGPRGRWPLDDRIVEVE